MECSVLQQAVGLMNLKLVLIVFYVINVQGKELCLHDFTEYVV